MRDRVPGFWMVAVLGAMAVGCGSGGAPIGPADADVVAADTAGPDDAGIDKVEAAVEAGPDLVADADVDAVDAGPEAAVEADVEADEEPAAEAVGEADDGATGEPIDDTLEEPGDAFPPEALDDAAPDVFGETAAEAATVEAPDDTASGEPAGDLAPTGDAAPEADTAADETTPADDTPPADSGYTGIYAGLENLQGPELVAKLCALVTTGYTSVSYSTAGDLVRGEIDSFNGQVEEIYTGTWVALGTGLTMEHTWPQSKGAGSVPAKSDMFHLYASDQNFNSARSNLAYGSVVTMDWPADYTGNQDCTDAFPDHPEGCFSIRGKDGQGIEVFEPRDAHKGNVARAVFYFSLRYGTDCQLRPMSDFDPDHPAVTVELYKVWNLFDPPDDDERARNDRIQKYQHVRNPFIDHPEFLDRIAFP